MEKIKVTIICTYSPGDEWIYEGLSIEEAMLKDDEDFRSGAFTVEQLLSKGYTFHFEVINETGK